MQKYFFGIIIFLLFANVSAAENYIFPWASFPVEKYEYLANESKGTYSATAPVCAIGELYISLDKRIIKFKGLLTPDSPLKAFSLFKDKSKYEFIYETFSINKIIKTSETSYTFSARKENSCGREISGKITLKKKNDMLFEVTGFEMVEFGEKYEGIMNKYTILKSKEAESLRKKFKEIDFGSFVLIKS